MQGIKALERKGHRCSSLIHGGLEHCSPKNVREDKEKGETLLARVMRPVHLTHSCSASHHPSKGGGSFRIPPPHSTYIAGVIQIPLQKRVDKGFYSNPDILSYFVITFD